MEVSSKKIVYISTNRSWSGSEELWSRSAKELSEKGFSISIITRYNHPEIAKLKTPHYFYSEQFQKKSILKRIIEKFFKVQFGNKDVIAEILKKEKPQLVILSQGNNIDEDGIMLCCKNLKIPYVTITHLVSEYFFLNVNNNNLLRYQQGYLHALQNFFVSEPNLQLNNFMLASDFSNTEVIHNPIKIKNADVPAYPKADNFYKVALVGRVECFHKGYDLLIKLADKKKWKERSIHFNIYGEGPHTTVLQANIKRLKLKNLTLKGHVNNIDEVWKENHILFMPSRMEGQALALTEAMFCNRAAIVTNVGGASELISDGYNGFIAVFPSIESLDNTLERAWTKRFDWQQLGLNAGKTIRTDYPADPVGIFNDKISKYLN